MTNQVVRPPFVVYIPASLSFLTYDDEARRPTFTSDIHSAALFPTLTAANHIAKAFSGAVLTETGYLLTLEERNA